MRIVHTKGSDPQQLAETLSASPIRIRGDLTEQCIAHRAEALVTRRLSSSFDLVPQVVPHGLRLQEARKVVAAVGGGPHSLLAATIAQMLAQSLDLPAVLVCAYTVEEGPDGAIRTVEDLRQAVPGLRHRVIEADRASGLIDEEAEEALLVLGAPGGSYFQRRFYGPGARLIAHTPVGAIAVKSAPRRVFHDMAEAEWVGRLLPAAEALRLSAIDPIPVVEEGLVVGIARREMLRAAGSTPIEDVMDPPTAVGIRASCSEAAAVAATVAGSIPVVDRRERLVGLWAPTMTG